MLPVSLFVRECVIPAANAVFVSLPGYGEKRHIVRILVIKEKLIKLALFA